MRSIRFLLIVIGITLSNYPITSKDSRGCITEETNPINLPLEIILSTVIFEPSCFDQCSGYIDLTVSGGQTPYTYSWNGDKGPEDLFDICAGEYTVVVTDENGSSAFLTVVVEQPDFLEADVYVTPASCSGACDGQIELDVSGGTPPYSYSNFTGMCGGLYSIFVIDANGCLLEIEVFVFSQSDGPSIDDIITTSETNGQADGSLTITASGACPPFSYSLNNGPFQASNIFTGLPAGVYLVSVKDGCGCIYETEVLISNLTSVNELKANFSLYPNPVNTYLHVESDLPCSIEMFDIHGQMIRHADKTKSHYLNVEDIIPGLYLVRISDGSGASYRRVIVQ